jgi:hypothetical protein
VECPKQQEDAAATADSNRAYRQKPHSKIDEATMTINLKMPDLTELKPRITVFGIGGAGGNAVNNMIQSGLQGVEFVVANTDAQALASSRAERIIQMGVAVTEGLGAGSQPRSMIIWPVRTWCSSLPAWAVAPAPVLRRSSPALPASMAY